MTKTDTTVVSETQILPVEEGPQLPPLVESAPSSDTHVDPVEASGVFVHVTAGTSAIPLRVDTRLQSEQDRIERANELIRRKGGA